MDSKKVIEKLIKIAENQQKIIQKLAQAQQSPDIIYEDKPRATTQVQPPPQRLEPSQFTQGGQSPGEVIFQNLPANLKPLISSVMAPGPNVKVHFQPGKQSPAVISALQALVSKLAQEGKIPNWKYTITPAA